MLRIDSSAFFVHGFAKNELDNIEDDELAALKKLAEERLAYDANAIELALSNKTLIEIHCYD